jgi:arginine utilization protein RocB
MSKKHGPIKIPTGLKADEIWVITHNGVSPLSLLEKTAVVFFLSSLYLPNCGFKSNNEKETHLRHSLFKTSTVPHFP